MSNRQILRLGTEALALQKVLEQAVAMQPTVWELSLKCADLAELSAVSEGSDTPEGVRLISGAVTNRQESTGGSK